MHTYKYVHLYSSLCSVSFLFSAILWFLNRYFRFQIQTSLLQFIKNARITTELKKMGLFETGLVSGWVPTSLPVPTQYWQLMANTARPHVINSNYWISKYIEFRPISYCWLFSSILSWSWGFLFCRGLKLDANFNSVVSIYIYI